MTDQAAPTAAVLIIGDEILSGRTRDTNLNTIARFLAALGIDLMEARTVGDRQSQIVEALNALRATYDYVFTTGGIGPTHDDITADAVGAAFGVPVNEHPDAVAVLERRYRPGEFNAARRRMARIPDGGTLIANPVTDAPGFQIGNVFVMAGVPKIMEAMLQDVVPRLRTGAVVHARTIRVEGVGEGGVAEVLRAAAEARPDLSFGSYPFGLGGEGPVGTQLVIRGRDEAKVDLAEHDLSRELRYLGINLAVTSPSQV
ncbi:MULTISPECIES: competence/damage-inducible protein A [unclassified Brevundimonas]|uniref:competence/damage-inducible protein A n=1 Tax=unclassified Brevundimonas TaxID=2622653 RepID=UPI0025B7AB35|nr:MULTISPECIES: competence/damage-inducible protein A [unclassified Brevundimonas]